MSVIAVTACLKRCSIAIQSDDGSIYEINEDLDATANLVGLTGELMEKSHMPWSGVKRIITASGPGSFTGIRTAQSMVQALSFSLQCEAVAISYFDIILALASQSNSQINASNTLVLIQNEKNHFYYAYGDEKGVVKPTHVSDFLLHKVAKIPLFVIGETDMTFLDSALSEIEYIKNNYDFRRALHFINCYNPEIATAVRPLYINAAC